MLMYDGFKIQREYEQRLHHESLAYNRLNTSLLINLQVKKDIKPEMLYKLPFDKKVERKKITKEQIIAFFEKKDKVITNGKLRGYKDKNGNIELIN